VRQKGVALIVRQRRTTLDNCQVSSGNAGHEQIGRYRPNGRCRRLGRLPNALMHQRQYVGWAKMEDTRSVTDWKYFPSYSKLFFFFNF